MAPKHIYLHLPQIIILTVCIFSFAAPIKIFAQQGMTFTVNVTGDESDPNAGEIGDDGHCDVDPNTPGDQCTFRAAIQNHNGNRELPQNFINFNIPNAPGQGSIVIKVGSSGNGPLPPVLGSVVISGVNSPDSRRIEIDGSMAGANAIGLQLLGGSCQISFLIINSFSSHGIFIGGTPPPGDGGHVLTALKIGTDNTGTIAKPNGGDGILIFNTPNNIIGGTGVQGNVIAGNVGYGIHITGGDSTMPQHGSATGNQLIGNGIGQDLLGISFLPNMQGGILNESTPNNTIGGSATNGGNNIVGVKNGITLTGNLTTGITIQGNNIGRDGTGQKFSAGIMGRGGNQLTIKGNILENIDSIGMDLFLNAAGGYNVLKNQLAGNMKTGVKFTFAPGSTFDITYTNNFHTGNDTGLVIAESANSTINWIIAGDTITQGGTGANLQFHSSGSKQLNNNIWSFNSGVGFKFAGDFAPGVHATFNFSGDAYLSNKQNGFSGNATLNAQTDITWSFLDIIGQNNGKDGFSLGVGTFAGATGTLNFSGKSDLSFNGGAAVRLIGDKTSIDVFKVSFDHIHIRGNHDATRAMYVLGFELKHSITNSLFADNTGAAIDIDGTTEARIANDTITNNGKGIVVEGSASGDIENNVISGNGKGVVITATGPGTLLSNNSIFNSKGLGIDLGDDGVTPNHIGGPVAGPNGLQNFPVLTNVSVSGGNTVISGTLNSAPNTTYALQLFFNPACNPSGFGEGQSLLDSLKVITDASGNASFTKTIPGVTVPGGSAITSTATDPNGNTSEFSACRTTGGVINTADLALTKRSDRSTLTLGEKVNYILVLTNKGTTVGTNIKIRDSLPAGLSFSQASVTAGIFDKTTGIWSISSLSAGSTDTLLLQAVIIKVGIIKNIAQIIASDQPDPVSTNNIDSALIAVVAATLKADLFISKTAVRSTIVAGDSIIYRILLGNKGPNKATGITVQDILPSSIHFVKYNATSGSFSNVTGNWIVSDLDSGKTDTLIIKALSTIPGTVKNKATIISSIVPDPVSGNNADSASISVSKVLLTADLALTKTVNNSQPVEGALIVYTVTLKNNGPQRATGIFVKDRLPAGLSFTRATPSKGSYDQTSGIWAIDTLHKGAQITLVIQAVAVSPGTIVNTATISKSSLADPVSRNNMSSSTIHVQPSQSIDDLFQNLISQVNALIAKGQIGVEPGAILIFILQRGLQLNDEHNYRESIEALKLFDFALELLNWFDGISLSNEWLLTSEAQKIIELLRKKIRMEDSPGITSNNELDSLRMEVNRFSGTELTNYPNPFRSSTIISFSVAGIGRVHVDIYNQNGQKIVHLIDETMTAGRHTVTWQASDLPAGVYTLRLTEGNRVRTRKLLHVK